MRTLFNLIGGIVAIVALALGWPHHTGHDGKYAAAAVIVIVFASLGAFISTILKARRERRTPSGTNRAYSSPFSQHPGRNVRR